MAIEALGAGKVASEIADTAVGKALLVPAATAIGNYLGERTEAWVERRRQKRLKNIEKHVHSFEKKLGTDPFETPDDKGVYEWIQGVADVNPDDPELVEVWQAALARLGEGGDKRRRLLEIVRSLGDDEARFVYRLAQSAADLRRIPLENRSLKDDLTKKGIILSNSDSFLQAARFGAILTVFFGFVVFFGYIAAASLVPSISTYVNLITIVTGIGTVAYMGTLRRGGYLSEDGRELIDWIRRIQAPTPKETESAVTK